MKINRGREHGSGSVRRLETFTGEVWGDPVLSGVDDIGINNVFFTPRARTNWHRHSGVQILIVLSGAGLAFTRGRRGRRDQGGDVVYIPADEEHWHGADAGSCMLHTAVTLGEHDWLDPVTDEQYEVFTGRVPERDRQLTRE